MTSRSVPNRQFRVLLAARVCVWSAGGIAAVALPLALFQRTGSASLTSALAAMEVIPYLLVGLLAGAVADRLRTRTVATTACVLCAVASGSVALAALLGDLTVTHLFAAAFGVGTALVFFDAAMFAALPAIVSRERLSVAFASMTAVQTVIALVAPTTGGFLSGLITPERTLLVNTALLFVGAGVFVILREPERIRGDGSSGILADIREGLRFVAGHRLIRALTALGVGNSINQGIVTGLLVATVVTVHRMPDNGPHVGIAYSALAVGALIGSRAISAFQRRAQLRVVTTTGLVLAAAGLAVWSQQPNYVVGLVGLTIYQIGTTTVILNGITQRARVTPDNLQGRVNTTARMFSWGGQPLGAIGGAVLVPVLQIQPTYLLAIGILLLTAAIAVRVLRPSAIETPAPTDAQVALD